MKQLGLVTVKLDQFVQLDKLVGSVDSIAFTGCNGFFDNAFELAPFLVLEQRLQLSCQPVFLTGFIVDVLDQVKLRLGLIQVIVIEKEEKEEDNQILSWDI